MQTSAVAMHKRKGPKCMGLFTAQFVVRRRFPWVAEYHFCTH